MAPAFATVIFDCDSTLSTLEGIEELASAHRAEVAELTDAAMRGDVPLDAVYGRRLALVRPTRAQVDALGRAYVAHLAPGARETIAGLRGRGVDVRVVSGGVLPAVTALARALGIETDRVAAVGLRFAPDGAYAGYDEASPLARAGGKQEVVERWLADGMRPPVMLVGDGATDLEAAGAVDAFVAYRGVVARPAVVAAARFVIDDLRQVLALVFPPE